jgi:hypothetical protein
MHWQLKYQQCDDSTINEIDGVQIDADYCKTMCKAIGEQEREKSSCLIQRLDVALTESDTAAPLYSGIDIPICTVFEKD